MATIDIPKPSQSSARPSALPSSIRYFVRLSRRHLKQLVQLYKDRLWRAVMSQLSLAFWSTTARAVTPVIAFYWTITQCTISPIGSLKLLGRKWRRKHQSFLSYHQSGWVYRMLCDSRWYHRNKRWIRKVGNGFVYGNIFGINQICCYRWHQSQLKFLQLLGWLEVDSGQYLKFNSIIQQKKIFSTIDWNSNEDLALYRITQSYQVFWCIESFEIVISWHIKSSRYLISDFVDRERNRFYWNRYFAATVCRRVHSRKHEAAFVNSYCCFCSTKLRSNPKIYLGSCARCQRCYDVPLYCNSFHHKTCFDNSRMRWRSWNRIARQRSESRRHNSRDYNNLWA